MSTAVIISGQMRTFAHCVANLNWMVFRHLPDPHFFISCPNDAQASDAYLIEGYFPGKVVVEIADPPADLPEPPFVLARHAPYAPTPNNPSVVKSIVRQLWHYRGAWRLAMAHVIKAEHYHAVVRCRPDLFFRKCEPLVRPQANKLWGPQTYEFWGPWKATCGGVNDRFSVMGAHAAEAYFTAFDRLQEFLDAGCPLHPESIQAEALRAAKCTAINLLNVQFDCLRMPGDPRPHAELLEYPGELAAYLAGQIKQGL